MKLGRTAKITEVYVHEGDGEQSADDGNSVKHVPHVTTIRARVKQNAAIDHLKQQPRYAMMPPNEMPFCPLCFL